MSGHDTDGRGEKSGNAEEGTRTDRRVVRTRRAIMDAFKGLLAQREPAKITVSAIAREANIDRKTFYLHFGSVDGLLQAVADDIVHEIVSTVERGFAHYQQSHDGTDAGTPLMGRDGRPLTIPDLGVVTAEAVEEAFCAFFDEVNKALCANLSNQRGMLASMSTDEIFSRLRRPLEREIFERRLVPEAMADERLEGAIAYFLAGILALYRNWVMDEDDRPIEEVSRLAYELTLNGLAAFRRN